LKAQREGSAGKRKLGGPRLSKIITKLYSTGKGVGAFLGPCGGRNIIEFSDRGPLCKEYLWFCFMTLALWYLRWALFRIVWETVRLLKGLWISDDLLVPEGDCRGDWILLTPQEGRGKIYEMSKGKTTWIYGRYRLNRGS